MKIQFLKTVGVDCTTSDGMESRSYRKYDEIPVVDINRQRQFSDITLTNGTIIFVENSDYKVTEL